MNDAPRPDAPRCDTPRPAVPPGWPAPVQPPQAPGWVRSAVAWMLDLCPPDYRGYPVLARHPPALAHLARAHARASLAATRQARADARAALGEVLPPPALGQLLEATDVEEARLLAAVRGVDLVAEALRGHRHRPRL